MFARKLGRSIASPLAVAISRVRGRAAGDPILALFANGEQGAWYNPPDLTTLYQDAAGTTPVTADGQSVGLMLDKSGNGNDASQSDSGKRPLYPGLEYDGVDDFLDLSAALPGLTTSTTVMMAVRRINTSRIVFMASDTTTGSQFIFAAESGASTASYKNSGSPSLLVDGVSIGTTRDDMHVATSDLNWHIIEAVNVDFQTNWVGIVTGNYAGTSFDQPNEVGDIIIVTGNDPAGRGKARQAIADRYGVTLP